MRKLTKAKRFGNERKLGLDNSVGRRGDCAQQTEPRARWLPFGERALGSDRAKRRGSTSWVRFRELQESVKENGLNFLHTDLDVGLTIMAQIAAEADRDSERRERNIRNARKAYDAVLKFCEKVHATSAERHQLRRKLRRLRLCLEDLGERFEFFARVA